MSRSTAEPSDAETQRAQHRDSLLLRAEIRSLDGHKPITAIVRNLSAGGMMAENAKLFAVGTNVEVEFRSIGAVQGAVVWTVENRMGIAFAEPIDPAAARKPVLKSVTPDQIVPRPKPLRRIR